MTASGPFRLAGWAFRHKRIQTSLRSVIMFARGSIVSRLFPKRCLAALIVLEEGSDV